MADLLSKVFQVFFLQPQKVSKTDRAHLPWFGCESNEWDGWYRVLHCYVTSVAVAIFLNTPGKNAWNLDCTLSHITKLREEFRKTPGTKKLSKVAWDNPDSQIFTRICWRFMTELFREQFWLRMTSGSSASGGRWYSRLSTLDSRVLLVVRWYKWYYISTGLPVPVPIR